MRGLLLAERPPLASKHPEINLTWLTPCVNSPGGTETLSLVLRAFRRNKQVPQKKGRSLGRRKKILLGKNQPKLFQTVSFCLQPHGLR